MRNLSRLCAELATAVALAAASVVTHAHWPGQPEHKIAQLGDLKLESGEVIKNFRMSYVTHGKLNAARDNTVVYLHGFASNHHGLDHLIGTGRALDTERYFIVCPDALGATQIDYEHTTSPTNSGLKMKFPLYTLYNQRDMVYATYRLLTEALGLQRVLAITGTSMGARHSVQFAVMHPNFMDAIIPVAGGATSTHGVAKGRFHRPVTAATITACRGWTNGEYDDNPKACATLGLSALVMHFYTPEWWEAYLDSPEAYTKWRNNIGEYLDVQDARDLYFMSLALGRTSVADTPGFDGDVIKALASIKAKSLYIYNPRD